MPGMAVDTMSRAPLVMRRFEMRPMSEPSRYSTRASSGVSVRARIDAVPASGTAEASSTSS